MEKPILKIDSREITGKKVKTLRVDGFLPAVLYGHNVESKSLTVPLKEFEGLYHEAGGNTIILLRDKDGKETNVLIHDVQLDGVTGRPIHVDFYQVKMTEKITTEIPIHFVGESSAVREMDGSFITNKDKVEVECLPGDLISEIEVDISVLTDFDVVIHVEDLKVPETIKILDDPEEAVAFVEPPRSEEELAELEEPVEEAEIPPAEEGQPEEAATEAEKAEKEIGEEKALEEEKKEE
ncbi:MAG: 50S ribosomal protein L25 [Patescibacteria group bacterium]|nr:50S ribosomal protein L25 [Patescibacteria group bacterium]